MGPPLLSSVREEIRTATHYEVLMTQWRAPAEVSLPNLEGLTDKHREHAEQAFETVKSHAEMEPEASCTSLQQNMWCLARFLKWQQAATLTEDLLDIRILPDGHLSRAMRAMGLAPDGLDAAQRRDELLRLARQSVAAGQDHPLQLDMDRFLQLPSSLQHKIVATASEAEKLSQLRPALAMTHGLQLPARLGADYRPTLQAHRELIRLMEVGSDVQTKPIAATLRRAIYAAEQRWTPEDPVTLLDVLRQPQNAQGSILPYITAMVLTDDDRTQKRWTDTRQWIRAQEPRMDTTGPWLHDNVQMLAQYVESLPQNDRPAGRDAVLRWMHAAECTMQDLEDPNPVRRALQPAQGLDAAQDRAPFLDHADLTLLAQPNQAVLSTNERRHLAAFYRLMNG